MKLWFTKWSLPFWRDDEVVLVLKKHVRRSVGGEENPGDKKVRVGRERGPYEAQFGGEVGERFHRSRVIFHRR